MIHKTKIKKLNFKTNKNKPFGEEGWKIQTGRGFPHEHKLLPALWSTTFAKHQIQNQQKHTISKKIKTQTKNSPT